MSCVAASGVAAACAERIARCRACSAAAVASAARVESDDDLSLCSFVIPAKAGIHSDSGWIPAFAGMPGEVPGARNYRFAGVGSGASAASGALRYFTNQSAAAFELISKGSFEYISKWPIFGTTMKFFCFAGTRS
jgi:hypothetical protein